MNRKVVRAEQVMASEGRRQCLISNLGQGALDLTGVREMERNESLIWNWRDPTWPIRDERREKV